MKRKYLIITLLFLAIGFAAVSTTLIINGTSLIKKNSDDFKVYYSDALVNGTQDLSVVVDDTHLSFKTTLDTLGQTYVLDYDVTNSSKQYDAALTMNCTGGNDYLTVVNSFDTVNNLLATETRRGTLTLTLAKSYSGSDLDVEITCTLGASAVERNELGEGEVPNPVEPLAKCEFEYSDLDNDGAISVGDEYNICDEKFNVVDANMESVTLLAKYNVGNESKQTEEDVITEDYAYAGFGDISREDLDEDFLTPLNNYKNYLTDLTKSSSIETTLITTSELSNLGCTFSTSNTGYDNNCMNSPYYSWLGNGQYWWTRSAMTTYTSMPKPIYAVYPTTGILNMYDDFDFEGAGIRPLVTISKDILNSLTNTEPVLGAELFCATKNYSQGMINPSTYSLGTYEEGDINNAYYLCSPDNFECDIYGYDLNGNKVYELSGSCTIEQ